MGENSKTEKTIGAVLAFRSEGSPRALAQTIGADGSGDYVFLFEGEPDTAEIAAREYLRERARNGERLENIILVRGNNEGYCGPSLRYVKLEQRKEKTGIAQIIYTPSMNISTN